eukprot:1798634-Rhodomonas_salina.1
MKMQMGLGNRMTMTMMKMKKMMMMKLMTGVRVDDDEADDVRESGLDFPTHPAPYAPGHAALHLDDDDGCGGFWGSE